MGIGLKFRCKRDNLPYYLSGDICEIVGKTNDESRYYVKFQNDPPRFRDGITTINITNSDFEIVYDPIILIVLSLFFWIPLIFLCVIFPTYLLLKDII